jgi:phenylacetate-CoA ligase
MKSFGPDDAALEAARRAASVPAYRDAWSQAGVDPEVLGPEDLARLPFVSKADLIAGAADDPPFGGRLACDRGDLAHVYVAPGPLYLPLTPGDVERMWNAQARAFAALGLGPEDIVDNTVGYHWVLGGALIDGGLRRLGCTVIPGGPGNRELHLESIRALGATAIIVFPTFLDALLELAGEQGLELPLRRAIISGEMHRSDFKAQCEAEHGIVVRERYGVSEIGVVAHECAEGDGLHLRDDLLVEAIDPITAEAVDLDSPDVKELVLTDPGREAMPIVRLRTGDLVQALELETCRCGSSAPRLRRIVGRTTSIPRVKGMFVVPGTVAEVLDRHGIQGRHQLRIERPGGSDRLTVVVERGPSDGLAVDVLAPALNTALRMRVEIEQVEALAADAPLVDDRRAIA